MSTGHCQPVQRDSSRDEPVTPRGYVAHQCSSRVALRWGLQAGCEVGRAAPKPQAVSCTNLSHCRLMTVLDVLSSHVHSQILIPPLLYLVLIHPVFPWSRGMNCHSVRTYAAVLCFTEAMQCSLPPILLCLVALSPVALLWPRFLVFFSRIHLLW